MDMDNEVRTKKDVYLARIQVFLVFLHLHVVAAVEGANLHLLVQVAPTAFDQVNSHPGLKDLMAGIVGAG